MNAAPLMKANPIAALPAYILALGDDELILGQRTSEWCGFAPILEEDIAFANIALDEIGHAALWYSLLSELTGQDPQTYPDKLTYFRDASDFRNAQMVELPNGDWAFSILRQYLFDAAELVRLGGLAHSRDALLAATAAKIQMEEIYHHRHTSAWVLRLGQGTQESHQRMQNALDELWPYTQQLFQHSPQQELLEQDGLVPASKSLLQAWEEQVSQHLKESGLEIPEHAAVDTSRELHTANFDSLIDDMQSVARLDPDAKW